MYLMMSYLLLMILDEFVERDAVCKALMSLMRQDVKGNSPNHQLGQSEEHGATYWSSNWHQWIDFFVYDLLRVWSFIFTKKILLENAQSYKQLESLLHSSSIGSPKSMIVMFLWLLGGIRRDAISSLWNLCLLSCKLQILPKGPSLLEHLNLSLPQQLVA
ncbi:uncharacterized protein LOC126671143 [Mercurialis annua]|uniref:uncharacterized protein LOC126671143 n=1 Tax=Mercurialis annua TaxID=3986 RepID=UPI0024AD2A40|nr:uncharacterized protein LOC126671143 [Mercurialis annua]